MSKISIRDKMFEILFLTEKQEYKILTKHFLVAIIKRLKLALILGFQQIRNLNTKENLTRKKQIKKLWFFILGV